MKSAIRPGGTIGILGGGQLGRMLAMAARPLGFRVHVLDPDPECPARPVAERTITASFDDAAAAEDLARHVDVVTLEIEKVGLASLDAAAKHAPVRPGRAVLAIIQDRGAQKQWLESHGFPIGPWTLAADAGAIGGAVQKFDARCFVKATRGGYDGRGQVMLEAGGDALDAWNQLGNVPCVVERGLDLALELSVMVARRPSGETVAFPPALNHHEARVLSWSVLPAPVPDALARRAVALASEVARALEIEGLVAIELFVLRDGTLLVNELAPRPHNTFHTTEFACTTGQFEQGIRAVCDLPLGSVDVIRPAAIANLLGDLWTTDGPPPFERVLAMRGVKLHLYGKTVARPGRKMGHLCATGSTRDEAVRRVLDARAALQR